MVLAHAWRPIAVEEMIRLKSKRPRYMRLAPLACIAALCGGAAGATALAQAAQPASKSPTNTSDQRSGTGGSQLDPCTVLTLSEVQTMIGGTITSPVEAPQGPTCIYKSTGAKAWITLSVERRTDYAKVAGWMKHGQKLTVGTHSGDCGQLGNDNLFLPLGNGRVVHVTAPCAIAKEIAATVVSRLGG
jgi:hypothetical protein